MPWRAFLPRSTSWRVGLRKRAPAEISLLRAERERMCARIGELEEESRALAGLTGEVEERLDGAIAEIREVLSRN
jgi:hypothetical protein